MNQIEDTLFNYNSRDYFTMPSFTYNKPMEVALDKILAKSPFSNVSQYLEYHVKKDTALIKSNPHKERLRVKITKKAKKQHIIVTADRYIS